MSDLPPDQISADELRALEVLQRLKQDAERCGHQFAGRMISPSGSRYLVATDEPDNIAAWIFEQDDRAMSSGLPATTNPPSRSGVALVFLRIRQILCAIRKRAHIQRSE
jgi:hypothetical protein